MFVFGGGGGALLPDTPAPIPTPILYTWQYYHSILLVKMTSGGHLDLPLLAFQVHFWLGDLNYFNRRSNKKIGSMLEYLRELGSSCITFRDLESSSKLILGSTWEYFKGAGGGGVRHYFSGRTDPPHPKRTHS